ncbi:MAG TPA: EAL domain-containing protein [Egibacteraceae bacterium]|nr:EAL domain-containing protein [Egibacteraceae bacterium]
MSHRILGVEDSPAQAERLRTVVSAAGFALDLAADGREALQRLDSRPYDLVVSDVVMPRMDGYELCRQIKATDPQLPVVLLTSLTDPVEIVRGLEAGADNFLRKPYDADQLVARLRTLLQRRERRSTADAPAGLEAILGEQRYAVTAERQQILDLLVSSFEDLVHTNGELLRRGEALSAARNDLHRQLEATEGERRRLDAVLKAVPDAMVITDEHGVITGASDRLVTLLGTTRDRLVGRSLFEEVRFRDSSGQEIPQEQRPIPRTLTEGIVEMGASFDLLVDTPDGAVPVIARAAPVHDRSGRTVAAVEALHEIGALAAHDALTKLPNQSLFVDRVARAATLSAERRRPYAVLAVTADRFARLRESLSPAGLDRILAELASRLRGLLARPDVQRRTILASAAYFGHEMFGVVLPDLEHEIHGVRLAHLVAERLSGSLVADGVPVEVTTTVAAVFGRTATPDPVQLVAAAVTAARRASQSGGGGVEVVDPAVSVRAGDTLRREAELREAIDAGDLRVHYQPQVDVGRETPVGVEALVRWHHPEHGLVPPTEFIPLAEETGLVVPLGWWVLREACRQAAAWRRELPGAGTLYVSVNLSPSQLDVADAPQRVAGVLEATGLPPGALTLEVTESGVVADARTATERLEALSALGVRIAVDDFGTGYASLLQLRRFPFHSLKIDRGFIAGMTSDAEDAAIVAASVGLAHTLGLESVAEGVETPEQLAQLCGLGCQLAQGYLWSRPLPPADLERWWLRKTEAASVQRLA